MTLHFEHGTKAVRYYSTEELESKPYRVYQIINLVNNKKYFGITGQEKNERFKEHKYNATAGKDTYFYRAIRKYGFENFRIDVMRAFETEEEMNKAEIFFIDFFDTTNPEKGYNMALGGEGRRGWVMSDKRKEMLSEAKSIPCVSLNLWTNEVQEWRSQTEAAKEIDVYPGTISYNISQPERFKTVARQYIFANTVEELYQRRKVLEEENFQNLPFVYIEKDTLKILEASPEDEKIGNILNPGFTTLNSVQGLYTVLRHNVDQILKEIKQYTIYTCVVDLNTFEARAFKENREAAEFVGCSAEYMASRTAKGRFSIDPCETQLFFKASQYDVETGAVLDIPFFNAVEKYDLEGNLIDTFVGIEKAWKATPEIVAKRSITRVVKGQRNQIRNYIFKSRPATIREFREMKKSFEF